MEAIQVYPAPKRYIAIRKRMLELGMDGKYVARKIGISPAAFSNRLNARIPWNLKEMYQIVKILRISPERMMEYFPQDGKGVVE